MTARVTANAIANANAIVPVTVTVTAARQRSYTIRALLVLRKEGVETEGKGLSLSVRAPSQYDVM